MAKKKKGRKRAIKKEAPRRLAPFAAVFGVLVLSAFALGLTLPQATASSSTIEGIRFPAVIATQYRDISRQLAIFEDAQSKAGKSVVDDSVIQSSLSQVQLDVAAGQFTSATSTIKSLSNQLKNWNLRLKTALEPITPETVGSSAAPTATPANGKFIPILLYHYTPVNFEQQLDYLEQHNYSVVDLDQVAAALHGSGSLPSKPVVITFDDGFANQMQAFDILKRHNMKATFYIIDGGPASRWCIGAGRRYQDPLQPPQGCGDTYLTWNQVRELDQSGLITIGGHTIDHSNLPSLSPEQQRYEIIQGKAELEAQLGHPVYHFAYPYGAFDATTVRIVREAGYLTATTTIPGTYQGPGQPFTLRRIRDTLTLP